jgi:uncharacterized LabA/DUF88 family protein
LRTFVYVDGYNLYYGLKKLCRPEDSWRWLDIRRMSESIIPKFLDVQHVRYFTAHVKPGGSSKHQRQQTFLRALRAHGVEIHKGRYETHEVELPLRDKPSKKVWVIRVEEKQTDVNLASQMLMDAFVRENPIRAAVVISNDSDLVCPVRLLREAGIAVGILNPHPKRPGGELRQIASFYNLIRRQKVMDAQFPVTITDEHGTFRRPERWN